MSLIGTIGAVSEVPLRDVAAAWYRSSAARGAGTSDRAGGRERWRRSLGLAVSPQARLGDLGHGPGGLVDEQPAVAELDVESR